MKLKKMPQLRGEPPYVYSRQTIYHMSITINALAQAIDYLAEEVERLKEELEKRSKV